MTTTTISEEVRPTGQRMRVLGMEQEILDNLAAPAPRRRRPRRMLAAACLPTNGYEGDGKQKWWQR